MNALPVAQMEKALAEKESLSPELVSDLRQVYDVIGISELEFRLRKEISQYTGKSKRGNGYRKLSTSIAEELFAFLEKQGYHEKKIEEIIDRRVPSHTYVNQFHNGKNICINYMNTLAFFFDIKYLVHNFEFNS